jgi:hypothetical protein
MRYKIHNSVPQGLSSIDLRLLFAIPKASLLRWNVFSYAPPISKVRSADHMSFRAFSFSFSTLYSKFTAFSPCSVPPFFCQKEVHDTIHVPKEKPTRFVSNLGDVCVLY